MRGARLADVLVALLIVAAIYVMVRPRSAGGQLVTAVTDVVVAVVKAAADLGSSTGDENG